MTNPQHEALVEAVARLKASWERVSCEMGNIQYPGMHADLEDAGSDLWDEFEKTSAALSATAATPSDELVRLRRVLEIIGSSKPPRLAVIDGGYSRGECGHGTPLSRQCYQCVTAFARAALKPQAKDV